MKTIKQIEEANKAKQEEYARTDWLGMDRLELCNRIVEDPTILDYIKNPAMTFTGVMWVHMLSNVDISKYVEWDRLAADDWTQLILATGNQYLDKCPTTILRNKHWDAIIMKYPVLAKYRPADVTMRDHSHHIGILGPDDFEDILHMLERGSMVLCLVNWILFTDDQLKEMQQVDYRILKYCGRPHIIHNEMWRNIVAADSSMVEHCPWDTFDGYDISRMLNKMPELVDRMSLNKMTEDEKAWLISRQPQLHDKVYPVKKTAKVSYKESQKIKKRDEVRRSGFSLEA